MDWTVSPLSPNIYFQALTPDVMILGDGILGRYLNLDTILRVGLSWWNYCSHKTKQGVCCLSPSTTYKEIVRRQSSVIQKWKLSSEIEFWYLDFGILVFITKGKIFFLILILIFFYLWCILSYIEMKQPWVYMCSPYRSPLPPPSPPAPSRFSQCTRSEHLSHASNLGWWSVSP